MSGRFTITKDLFHMDTSAIPEIRLDRLFTLSHQRLYRLGCRMTGDPDTAGDLVQETFLRAATHPGAVPAADAAAEAWLVRVMVNLCHDRHRKAAVRLRFVERIGREEAAPDLESAVMAQNLVRVAPASLSPRRRAIVSLLELEGLSVREVAQILHLTEVTVRWHLAKARKEMAKRLSQGALPEGDES